MQPERIGATDRAAGGDELIEPGRAGLQGARELLLLDPDAIEDLVAVVPQCRVRIAHQLGDDLAGLAEERRCDAEQPPVTHGPAHDATQDITRPIVRRPHALAEQERHGA